VLLVVCILLVPVPAGCGGSSAPSGPHITDARLAHDYQSGKAIGPTGTFAPTDSIFHLVVNIGSPNNGTRVGATWYVVNAGDVKNQKLDSAEVALSLGQDVAHFTLTSHKQWLKGSYRVDIFLDSRKDRSLDFRVA
jgi:hypothetical protein